jgi:cyclopropane fatty-acyl-phospholipid synthase-like methyltransferase
LSERDIVRRGYDAIAGRYAEWSQNEITDAPNFHYLERLSALLPDGSDVLELGCGNGEPAARLLAERHRYVGVDVSPVQLERARQHVSGATFLRADYTTLARDAASVDAAVAIATISHLPRDEHPALFARIHDWLRPGGLFLASLSSRDDLGSVQQNFLGAPMFFSGWDADTNRRLLRDAGFELLEDEVITQDEGEEGKVTFLWVIARRHA